MGESKELRKLRKKVERLEARVDQLEKGTSDSRFKEVATQALLILEIIAAIVAIVSGVID